MNVYYFNTLLQILLGLNRQTVIGRAAFKKVKYGGQKIKPVFFVFAFRSVVGLSQKTVTR